MPENASSFVAILLLRAGVTGAFALWLLARESTWHEIFRAGAVYALVDGGAGLMMAGLLMRHRPVRAPLLLVAMSLTDALVRLLAGIAILRFPGIPEFPITIVLSFGALGAWALSAGVIAMVAWFVAHERHKPIGPLPRSGAHAIFDPLSVAGVMAFIGAISALIAGPPSTAGSLRFVAGISSGVLALIFLAGALGAARRPPVTYVPAG